MAEKYAYFTAKNEFIRAFSTRKWLFKQMLAVKSDLKTRFSPPSNALAGVFARKCCV